MQTLTQKQADALDFIATYIVERQRPPTRKSIAQHFGWASNNAAEDMLAALERKGYIVRDGDGDGAHWHRYPRVIRWPDCVLPVIKLAQTELQQAA